MSYQDIIQNIISLVYLLGEIKIHYLGFVVTNLVGGNKLCNFLQSGILRHSFFFTFLHKGKECVPIKKAFGSNVESSARTGLQTVND